MIKVPTLPLAAGEFILRRWRREDAEWYLRSRDEQVFTWTTEPRDLTVDAIASAIESNLREPKWIAFAIARRDGSPVGNISLVPQADSRSAEASYWLAPEGRGSGAATSALNALTNWAFANLSELEMIFLKIAPRNERSLAVARRCGFVDTASDGERLRFERRR